MARADDTTRAVIRGKERISMKKTHVIWMTRKMPVNALHRMRVLAARFSTGHRSMPLWQVHQTALLEGLSALEKKHGVSR